MRFRIRRRRVWRSMQRAGMNLLEDAATSLQSSQPSATEIHEARKCIKRARALLSLVRIPLGNCARDLDRRLRDINRSLSQRRDSDVAKSVLGDLLPSLDTEASGEFVGAVSGQIAESPAAEPLELVARKLHDATRLWASAKADGDGWDLIREDLERVYRRGRKRTKTLQHGLDVEALHDLRKSAKRLQYAMEFLEPLGPERIAGERTQIEELTDALGRHHDLAVVEEAIHKADQKPHAALRKATLTRLQVQKRHLESEALRLAAIVYAEKPADYVKRFGRYWRAWRSASSRTKSPTEVRAGAPVNEG